MTLTFVCIGNDEREHLEVLLPQLKALGDEVVYVDCESKDGSYEYAKNLGIKVLQKPRHVNAGVNRTFGFEVATSDWIFYVDPDERFPIEIFQELRERVRLDPSVCGFKLPRKNFYFGKWLKQGGQFPDNQVRIFQRGKGRFALKHVHDRLQVDGPVGTLQSAMEHYPYLTISQFIKKFDFYSSFEARVLFEQGEKINFINHWKYLFFKPLNRFFRRYIIKRGFMDGLPGFFAAFFDAVGWMTRYFKLWEIHKNK
jgi:glycosyltransferase involved in cell wall biosynthesis